MRTLRLCAVHKCRLFERDEPAWDLAGGPESREDGKWEQSSGLFCPMPLPGEKRGHECLAWLVSCDGRITASGSYHPTQNDEYVWLDDEFFWPSRLHVERLTEIMTGAQGRSVARVVVGSSVIE